MLNMMWAMRIVWMPSGKSAPPVSVFHGSVAEATNSVSRLAPRTISGVAIGMKMNRLVLERPLKL